MSPSERPEPSAVDAAKGDAREERLRQALRMNLKRRKAKARAAGDATRAEDAAEGAKKAPPRPNDPAR